MPPSRTKIMGGPLTPTILFGWVDEAGNTHGILVDNKEALATIDFVHHEIHEGEMWSASVYDAAVADDATLILCSPDPIGDVYHMTFVASCAGLATIELVENAQPTDGSNINAYNLNRPVGDAGSLTWLKDPTLGGGTVIGGPMVLPGGSGPMAGGGAITTRDNEEWMSNSLYAYAVRLTNISGSSREASIQITYYS